MKNSSRTLAGLASLVLVSACAGQATLPPPSSAAQARSGIPAIRPSARQVVAAPSALAALGVRDEGPAPASSRLRIAVVLRYRNQATLDRVVAEQSDRASARYRRWLTNAQFGARFAPLPATYRAVERSLQAQGLRVVRTYADRTVIDASGTVAAIERLFDTSLHRVSATGQPSAYANVRPAYAPKGLRNVLLGVDGLNTVVVVRPDHVRVTPGSKRASIPAAGTSSLFGPVSSVTGARGYAPLAFSAAYDLPGRHAAPGTGTYDGLGRASGIVIDADFAESDLRAYLAYFHVKRTGPATKRILLQGGPPKGDAAPDSVEAVLDAEALVGTAPGTALSIYEIPSLRNASITDAYARVVSDNTVDTVNSSFGGCEASVGANTARDWSALAEQGAAKGITFHASSGDSGGALCANAPASSPYVVAVGGTALTIGAGGAWASEIGWSGSGAGISTLFATPAWQNGVAGVVARGRNVPDVALDADPYSGIALYYTGTWNTEYNPLGGTSLSSPLFGAAITEIDQVKGGRMGLAAASLYGVLSTDGYGSGASAYFHDIVAGTNGTFYAGPGYDLVTGIGSLDGWNLAGAV